MKEKIKKLYEKDNKESYKNLKELAESSILNKELYNYFEEFLTMLKNSNSVIRIRGFILICYLSKWDKDNKINENINIILNELDDKISTNVRQSLNKIELIIKYKPELNNNILNKLKNLDITMYKETMQELIKKDIKKLLTLLLEDGIY